MREIKWFLLVVVLFVSCQNEAPMVPKPRAFPKVNYPEGKVLKEYNNQECPFTFKYPEYSNLVVDSSFFQKDVSRNCWFDITTEPLKGRVHFSYYPVEGESRFDELLSDAFELSNKHNSKANYIEEIVFRKENKVSGVIFKMEGPVASPYQFFVTDSANHFLRGALYVNAKSKPDSLKPIYDFLIKDIDRLLNSFEWKE